MVSNPDISYKLKHSRLYLPFDRGDDKVFRERSKYDILFIRVIDKKYQYCRCRVRYKAETREREDAKDYCGFGEQYKKGGDG